MGTQAGAENEAAQVTLTRAGAESEVSGVLC